MRNPFKKAKKRAEPPSASAPVTEIEAPAEEEPSAASPIPEELPATEKAPVPCAPEPDSSADDGFTEWARSATRGGIERRERSDIYEMYSIYGADAAGQLCCRLYHRYPEHERSFNLSSSRALSFGDFNRRLLAELDQGGLKLDDYHACITNAERLTGQPEDAPENYRGFSEEEEAALRAFCDSADILQGQRYLHSEGVLSCECGSAVGDERLNLRFRKPLPNDALMTDVAGVRREKLGIYDVDNLWIMGVCNRLRDRCERVGVFRLTSEWSLSHESLWLIRCEGFAGIGGDLLAAAGEADSFRRFGFYSLDFAGK